MSVDVDELEVSCGCGTRLRSAEKRLYGDRAEAAVDERSSSTSGFELAETFEGAAFVEADRVRRSGDSGAATPSPMADTEEEILGAAPLDEELSRTGTSVSFEPDREMAAVGEIVSEDSKVEVCRL